MENGETRTGFGTQTLRIARRTVAQWLDDDAIRWSAAIAYYAVVSLAPLVVLAVTVAGQFIGGPVAERWILEQVGIMGGPQATEVAETVVNRMTALDLTSLGAIFTILLLAFGATAVFANLQRALNGVWAVEPRAGVLRNLVRSRVAAFTAVAALGGIMILSVVAGAVLGRLTPILEVLDPFVPLVPVVDLLTSLLLLWLAVSTVFQALPDVEIRWRDVWIGALVTATLLVVGKHLLSWFLARKAAASLYGAAGSIFLLLLWVYYSALVFFLGAEFTQVWANERGREIRPADYAVRVRTVIEEPDPAADGGP
ncbi:MAG: YihY/virulence factor BrkB family protein [Longimicrobiales bacterium]